MSTKQLNTTIINKESSGSSYKVVKINMADPAQNVYAVVTPVKIKD